MQYWIQLESHLHWRLMIGYLEYLEDIDTLKIKCLIWNIPSRKCPQIQFNCNIFVTNIAVNVLQRSIECQPTELQLVEQVKVFGAAYFYVWQPHFASLGIIMIIYHHLDMLDLELSVLWCAYYVYISAGMYGFGRSMNRMF